jgi:hypothetical protein
VRRRRRGGSTAAFGEDELDGDEGERASARGSASSTLRTTAELVDKSVRRGDDGERELHGGAGAAASAMVRESEGERQGSV